ncbi:NAD-dependent deacylase [Actinoplanes sp. DH11]|uniref:SIR2 family NAD-dependent protein deacylase n=1 Tax=Actinoplanes sp. DH11 TaxID=2857011 RepID=UPI001E5AFEB5|nr:NAD-dependent deacylase [Actinoplanes sp. DH11]
MTDLQEAAKLLAAAQRVVVFTGAGISAESGVPTFRDALTGLWARFDAQALATAQAFRDDPDLVWGWYEWRRHRVRSVHPNAGHLAVTAIEARAEHTTLVTQNVDDLHERAGSANPVHLHGSLFAPRCAECGTAATAPSDKAGDKAGDKAHDQAEDRAGGRPGGPTGGRPGDLAGDAEEPDQGRRIRPPVCARCGGLIRPGVVWFGESLPEAALESAARSASGCDVLLTVGTSGLVYPAAEIPRLAARAGAAVIQVNPQPTPMDSVALVSLRGSAARILPDLVAAAWPDTEADRGRQA